MIRETPLSLVLFSLIPSWTVNQKPLCKRTQDYCVWVKCNHRTCEGQGSLRKGSSRQLHIFQKLAIGTILHPTGENQLSSLLWLPCASAVGLSPPAHPLRVGPGAPSSSGPAPSSCLNYPVLVSVHTAVTFGFHSSSASLRQGKDGSATLSHCLFPGSCDLRRRMSE